MRLIRWLSSALSVSIARTTLVATLRRLEDMRLLSVGYRAIRILNSAGLLALQNGDAAGPTETV